VVWQFARLKLRLIRNALRAPQYAVLFTIGAVGAAVLAFVGFVALAGLRNDGSVENATLVAFAGVTMLWTVVPLLGFGTDETLDPQRLALLPLTRWQLMRGLLLAALVGVAPIATAFGLSGAVVGLARDPLTALLILASVLATMLLCVTASRTLISLLAPLLRSRRGRDLMVMAITLAAFVPASLHLFTTQGRPSDARRTFAELAARVRWTPFALGGVAATQAGRGHVLASIAALLGIVAIVAGLLVLWAYLIPRAMTTADSAGTAESGKRVAAARLPLYPTWLPFLPRDRAGATAAKELRYYVRDPRRRAPLITALIIPALFMLQILRDGQTRPAGTTLLALVALLPASGLTLNQFGLDGAASWATVVAGNDIDSDFRGKNLATLVVVFPLVLVPAIVIAWAVHGWAYLPLTLALAPGLLGVILGVGDVVSAWAPYAIPDRKNPLASNPGQGCVGGFAALGAIVVDVALLVPVGIPIWIMLASLPLGVATVTCAAVAGGYGYAIWRLGKGRSTRRLQWRMPELLDAVSPRQAA
jgi:ABC-2 type transport system permease protein